MEAAEKHYDREAVASLLSRAVGDEKALTVVNEAALRIGVIVGQPLTLEEALSVLEMIAKEPGVLGVTARFAKGRIHFL